MSSRSETSNNLPSSSDEPIPSRSNGLQARAEIVEEHIEANRTPVSSQQRQDNAHSTSDETKDHKKKKSWWRKIFNHWRRPKTTHNQFFEHHGHRTDILRKPVDVVKVLSESVTGGSTQPHAESERPTEKES